MLKNVKDMKNMKIKIYRSQEYASAINNQSFNWYIDINCTLPEEADFKAMIPNGVDVWEIEEAIKASRECDFSKKIAEINKETENYLFMKPCQYFSQKDIDLRIANNEKAVSWMNENSAFSNLFEQVKVIYEVVTIEAYSTPAFDFKKVKCPSCIKYNSDSGSEIVIIKK